MNNLNYISKQKAQFKKRIEANDILNNQIQIELKDFDSLSSAEKEKLTDRMEVVSAEYRTIKAGLEALVSSFEQSETFKKDSDLKAQIENTTDSLEKNNLLNQRFDLLTAYCLEHGLQAN